MNRFHRFLASLLALVLTLEPTVVQGSNLLAAQPLAGGARVCFQTQALENRLTSFFQGNKGATLIGVAAIGSLLVAGVVSLERASAQAFWLQRKDFPPPATRKAPSANEAPEAPPTEQRLQDLIRQLNDSSSEIRLAARRELGRLGDKFDPKTRYFEVQNALSSAFEAAHDARHEAAGIIKLMILQSRAEARNRGGVMVANPPWLGHPSPEVIGIYQAARTQINMDKGGPPTEGELEFAEVQWRHLADLGAASLVKTDAKTNTVEFPSFKRLHGPNARELDFYLTAHYLALLGVAQGRLTLYGSVDMKAARQLITSIVETGEVDPAFGSRITREFKVGDQALTSSTPQSFLFNTTRALAHAWISHLNNRMSANAAGALHDIDELASDVVGMAMFEVLGLPRPDSDLVMAPLLRPIIVAEGSRPDLGQRLLEAVRAELPWVSGRTSVELFLAAVQQRFKLRQTPEPRRLADAA